MIILDATNRSLQVLLAASAATTELPVTCSYVDIEQSTAALSGISSNTTVTTGTTAVSAAAAPSSGYSRQVKTLVVYNGDTSAATVTVRFNDNSTMRILCKITLQVGDTLQYTDGEGFRVVTSTGAQRTASTDPNAIPMAVAMAVSLG